MSDLTFLFKMFLLIVFSGTTATLGEFLIGSIDNGIYKIIILLLSIIMISNFAAKTITIFLERKTLRD